ncbi:MAG: zf-HC2 domain-containing protein [Gammaproteobacteria bacterium]|nr:zf-HC2 domain-containing protein [Gammaproteobacteria bacterium]
MLSCKEIGELLSQGIDRKLSLREKWGLKFHLFICKTCSCYDKQLQFIARSARRLMQPEKDNQGIPPLSNEAEARINNAIKQRLDKRENNNE